MTSQGALTIVTPIIRTQLVSLRKLLVKIKKDVTGKPPNPIIPFLKLSTIHFARWVILEQEEGWEFGEPFGPLLVFSTNFDGMLCTHLDQLVNIAGSGLDKIYQYCESYPGNTHLRKYLENHQSDYEAFYNGHQLRSVQQIQDEKQLRETIEQQLDIWVADGSLNGQTPKKIRKRIQNVVKEKPDLSPLLETPEKPFNYNKLLVGLGLGIAILFIVSSSFKFIIILLLDNVR